MLVQFSCLETSKKRLVFEFKTINHLYSGIGDQYRVFIDKKSNITYYGGNHIVHIEIYVCLHHKTPFTNI